MRVYKTNKKVLAVKNNPAQFLNGITANSLDQPRNAFVNVHGKIVATFDQQKISDDEFWIVLEEGFVSPVLEHVDKFVKLSGVKIERIDKEVYFDLLGTVPLEGAVPFPQKAGQLVVTNFELEVNVSEEEFTLFRLKNDIPLLGVDYKDDFLLNVSEEEFVSFTKGCFLGQEPISKVHNRSKPTWKLVVKNEEKCNEEEKQKMTSKITDPETGRLNGFVFSRNE